MVNGQKIDHDHDTLDFAHGQWSKMTNFDHLTTAILKFWPWSWSKIFDHLTMTPGRRPNGQKIVVILPPPLICYLITDEGVWRRDHLSVPDFGRVAERIRTRLDKNQSLSLVSDTKTRTTASPKSTRFFVLFL